MQQKRFLIFLVGSFVILTGWMWLENKIWPRKPKEKPAPEKPAPPAWVWHRQPLAVQGQVFARLTAAAAPAGLGLDDAWRTAAAVALALEEPDLLPKPELIAAPHLEPGQEVPARPELTKGDEIILGDQTGQDAKFNLYVKLDRRGGGVRSVVLNRFQQADKAGKPEWQDAAKKVPKPLELVTEELNEFNPSYLLYHFKDPEKADQPLKTLSQVEWKVVDELRDDDQHQVVLETVLDDAVILTKTYTLQREDYHISLSLKLRLKEGAEPRKFRYVLYGPHGLRVEGDWYTSIFRNAVVVKVDKGNKPWHTMTDGREIARYLGEDESKKAKEPSWKKKTGWIKEDDKDLLYWGDLVQFFASVVVLDDRQAPGVKPDFMDAVEPVTVYGRVKGKIKDIAADRSSFKLLTESGMLFWSKSEEYVFRTSPGVLGEWKDGNKVGVVFRKDSDKPVATEIMPQARADTLFLDDIAVRANSKAVELKPDQEVVHNFLLYNGPVKVRLLGQLSGVKDVPDELIQRYRDTLHLNKLTDYASDGWFFEKSLFSYVGLTDVLIFCTNLMHNVLYWIHRFIMPWSWGLCIILLTVLVRGLMFPVSRKQALTSMRMQTLAPELKKLQEKYKGDRQAMGLAQMELYRKHGINPLGSCWLILLQMPIFLGLYYALQESIHFRLAPFLYMPNLAAPDMLLWWSESIPFISQPEYYGWFTYLGPYLNVLPVIAVALMIAQQKMTMPPPTDEQQEMQQKMMKYMMIFFGLMFYKVAAGLCIYFIASSLWGFAERKLLPKKKTGTEGGTSSGEDKPGLMGKLLDRLEEFRKQRQEAVTVAAPAGTPSSPAITTTPESRGPSKRKEARKKRKQERDKRRLDGPVVNGGNGPAGPPGVPPPQKGRSWWSGLREWWADVLKKAQKR